MRDDEVAGVPPGDRLARFDEAVRALRALLGRDAEPLAGRWYSTADISLEPTPGAGRPPLWLAAWGGPRGLRRAAALGDGWLASGYNTTPAGFAASWATVREAVAARGGDPGSFANGVATLWTFVTEDRGGADRVLSEVLSPLAGRPVGALRDLALPIGPAEVVAERLAAFAAAGALRLFVWPLGDEERQLGLIAERVAPLVRAAA